MRLDWREREGGARRAILWACLLVFLLASTVQACHFCGLPGANGDYSVSTPGPATQSGSLCPICLSSQPASAPATLVSLLPRFAAAPKAKPAEEVFRSGETLFALYIRPPPSL